MNPVDPATAAAVSNWGFFEWTCSFAVGIATTLFGHLYHRINSNETLTRKVEHDLREAIAKAVDQASEGRDDLRREIQTSLQAISFRLDQTPTRNDMMDIISLAIDQKIQR